MLGWKFSYSSQNTKTDFINAPRKICIAAHSTPYFDGIIVYNALKYFGIREPVMYIRVFSSYITPYLHKSCMAIPSNSGFIKNECVALEHIPEFCRLIFPSGGKIYWKTGFYVLAKILGAKIVIIGIDYKTRSVVIDSVIDPRLHTFEETKKICIDRLCNYEPGPFCYVLRVLCNYGCETYMFDVKTLWSIRLYILLFVYCIIVSICPKIKYYT
jgi:hypothetical protein